MDDAQAGILGEFMSITGMDDTTNALRILEASNWALEEAVNLFFATGGDLGGGGQGAAAGGGGAARPSGIPADLPPLDEEDVRAPMPTVVDRLYGDVPGPHSIPARVTRYRAPPDRGPAHVDVFRDFGPESAATDPNRSAARAGTGLSSTAAASVTGGAAANAPKLSDLFKPPAGLVFMGDWPAAGAEAGKQGKWLLVNVQSPDEFATHQLNRDTWGDALVQDMLKGSFIFWQCYNTSDQGQQLISNYHLEELPAVFIVDPITGAKVWERYGFIPAEGMVEELVPFLDAGPNDPGASALAQRAIQQSAKRRTKAAAAAAASTPAAGADMTEDEQLALALAMSVEEPGQAAASNTAAAAAAPSNSMSDDIDDEAIWQEVQRRQREEERAKAAAAAAAWHQQPAAAAGSAANQLADQDQALQQGVSGASGAGPAAAEPVADVTAAQAAAAARLPVEPADGAAGSCRVAFRLPDGSRVQRRFSSTDTVATLQDYVISVSADAAAMSAFQLCEARPGAPVLADPGSTIQQAGVAGAMLVIKNSS